VAVGEQPKLCHQFSGEIVAQQRDVIFCPAHLEEFLAAGQGRVTSSVQRVPAFFDVHRDGVAQVIGVDTEAAPRVHHSGVYSGELDHLCGRHAVILLEECGVPVSGPTLVQDLGKELGIEVVQLLPEDLQHVLLPGVERGIGG